MDHSTTTPNTCSSEPIPNISATLTFNEVEATNLNNPNTTTTTTSTKDIKLTSTNPTFVSRTQQKLFLQKDQWKSEIDSPTTPLEHLKLIKELERIHKEFQALLRLESQPVQNALTRILGPIFP